MTDDTPRSCDVVGEPIMVSDTSGTQDYPRGHETAQTTSTACAHLNPICGVAYFILLVDVGIMCALMAEAFLRENPDARSARSFVTLLKVLRLAFVLEPLTVCVGICYMRRISHVPRGCEWLFCNCEGLPWSVLLGGVVRLWEHVAFLARFQYWWETAITFLRTLLVFAFVLMWIRKLAKQGADKINFKRGTEVPLEERFAAEMTQDRNKFERAYVVVEAIFIAAFVAHVAFSENRSDFHQVMYLAFIPACNVLRIQRCFIANDAPSWKMDVLVAVLDALNFSWNAFLVGVNGTVDASGFVVSSMLTYMVLFVFPLSRALIVVPLCYVSYCIAIFSFSEETMSFGAAALSIYFGSGLCLNLVANHIIASSKRKAFLALNEKTAQALKEKILRFQAEFARDTARTCSRRLDVDDLSSSKGLVEANVSAVHAPKHFARASPPSVSSAPTQSAKSAPTILYNSLWNSLSTSKSCVHGDCLSPDAMVWVRDEPRAKRLSSLNSGEHVLCFDHLGRSIKHAEVMEIRSVDGPKEWVSVSLADGTSLDMTCDHPVQPACEDANVEPHVLSRRRVKRAADLQAGVDNLMVLKVVPVRVESLSFKADHKPRVLLSVRQAERHSIFVSSSDQANAPLQTMAVDSSSLATGYCKDLIARHTFIEVLDNQGNADGASTRQQAASAPPSICKGAIGRGHNNTNTTIDSIGLDTAVETPRSQTSWTTSADSSKTDESGLKIFLGTNQAAVAASTQLNDHVEQAEKHESHALSSSGSARLSELLRVRWAGLLSLGSVLHQRGECKPCVHENRRQHFASKSCFKGELCERCHEGHPDVRQQKRDVRKEHRREAWQERRNKPSLGSHTLRVE